MMTRQGKNAPPQAGWPQACYAAFEKMMAEANPGCHTFNPNEQLTYAIHFI